MKNLDKNSILSNIEMSGLQGGRLMHSSWSLGSLASQDVWDDANNDGTISPDEYDSLMIVSVNTK